VRVNNRTGQVFQIASTWYQVISSRDEPLEEMFPQNHLLLSLNNTKSTTWVSEQYLITQDSNGRRIF
jgi:heat shock protein HspQ